MIETPPRPSASAPAKDFELERCRHEDVEEICLSLDSGRESSYDCPFSPEELIIARRFSAKKRRKDWLAARLAGKRLLARRLGRDGIAIKGSEITILNRPEGPPYYRIPRHPAVETYPLSISHSGGCGVAAITKPGRLIGVDLETISLRDDSFLRLIAHETERCPALDSDPVEQIRLWTLKEAAAKVLGTGLSVGFFDVRFPVRQLPPPGNCPRTGGRLLLSGGLRSPSVDRGFEFHGEALARWKKLGSPKIYFYVEIDPKQVLTAAFTKNQESTPDA